MAAKNISRFVILGFLNWRPMTGYDIKKLLEEEIYDFWSESYGTIYPTLKKLIAEGLAEKTVRKQEGKPDRIIYTITPAGQEQLREWLQQPFDLPRMRNEFLVKILFGDTGQKETIIMHIERYRDMYEKKMKAYKKSEIKMRENMKKDKNEVYSYLTLLQGIHIAKARLEWCREALSILNETIN